MTWEMRDLEFLSLLSRELRFRAMERDVEVWERVLMLGLDVDR